MLTSAPVMATIPVVDIKRATKFYSETLGLKVSKSGEGEAFLECGDKTMLYLFQRGATKADHTIAGFMVQDVEAEVKALRSKGVTFEEYDVPGLKTVNGIATVPGHKSAWFKDTEGNILAVNQEL
jgi:predicted enzyme related to lactoylglutathione lyase